MFSLDQFDLGHVFVLTLKAPSTPYEGSRDLVACFRYRPSFSGVEGTWDCWRMEDKLMPEWCLGWESPPRDEVKTGILLNGTNSEEEGREGGSDVFVDQNTQS